MNIRLKVTASIAALCAILGAAEILVEQNVLMPSFVELERADAHTAMRRINFALEMRLERLAAGAKDWGNWSDTYRFVQDRNATYAAESATDFALRQLKVDAFAVLDLEGHLLLVKELPLGDSGAAHLSELSGSSLPRNFPWRMPLSPGQALKGFLLSDRGTFMLTAAPVLDGKGGGPVRGTILMGRLLSADEAQAIGAQAQAEIAIEQPRVELAAEGLTESEQTTEVYRTIDDIYGKPIFTVRVDVPRSITERGRSAVTYASAYLGGALLILLITLVIVLNQVILRPLDRLTRHAIAIGKDPNFTQRLNLVSRDEMATLAHELDRTVARLAESRRQLVDRSFEAGHAEMAKGVLHNLGNAMTPIGVRLVGLGERLRSAPLEETEQAATELGTPAADPQRHAQLREFIRLGSRELIEIIRAAAADVEVMSRQAIAMQSMLVEQRLAARNEHVIEAVRLPELIAQALEIVPDSAQARLCIQLDESVKSMGVVQVARTVLRLVLQNIIINAADAVRETHKDKGQLRICAAIARDGDSEQLRLQCEDDGVGIAPENLSRIFEPGFSTKSRDTNSGIGLHWCGNAVGALGGRMWASSAGLGRGASIHVVLPLPARESVLIAGAA